MSTLPLRFAIALIWLAVASQVWGGVNEGDAATQRGDYATALKEYLAAAEQGDAGAQFRLGVNYRTGMGGVGRDNQQALYWFRKAAEQGDAGAQRELALLYYYGLDDKYIGNRVPEDTYRAVY